MGDFDRIPDAPKKTSNKQFAALGGLGLVLLVLVTYEITGKGPQTAQASAVNSAAGAGDPVLAAESPAQVIEGLRVDATENLLLPPKQEGPEKLALRNPFRMADRWRAALTPATVTKTPELPTIQRPEPTRVAADGYKLMMVSGQTAVVNNKIVTEGAIVDGARVLAIRPDGVVVLQAADSPDGPRTELHLSAPLNR